MRAKTLKYVHVIVSYTVLDTLFYTCDNMNQYNLSIALPFTRYNMLLRNLLHSMWSWHLAAEIETSFKYILVQSIVTRVQDYVSAGLSVAII
jgi:hypothetical protein